MKTSPEHFCTLFDHGYLPQGIVLHRSLRRHRPDAVLWVLCMDDRCLEAIRKLDLPGTRILRLPDLETPELLHAKAERSWGEYCWTMTPHLLSHLLGLDGVDRATYLDADIRFEADPAILIEEMEAAGKRILVTPHDFGEGYGRPDLFGEFCVQFLTATADDDSRAIVDEWASQCRRWCFATKDGTGFGDQKYLDRWPIDHGDVVHVLEHPERAHGPWRHSLLPWSRRGTEPHVLHHFHKLRLYPGGRIRLFRGYWIPAWNRGPGYRGIVHDLREALSDLRSIGIEWSPAPLRESPGGRLLSFLLRLASFEGWARL